MLNVCSQATRTHRPQLNKKESIFSWWGEVFKEGWSSWLTHLQLVLSSATALILWSALHSLPDYVWLHNEGYGWTARISLSDVLLACFLCSTSSRTVFFLDFSSRWCNLWALAPQATLPPSLLPLCHQAFLHLGPSMSRSPAGPQSEPAPAASGACEINSFKTIPLYWFPLLGPATITHKSQDSCHNYFFFYIMSSQVSSWKMFFFSHHYEIWRISDTSNNSINPTFPVKTSHTDESIVS